MKNKTILKILYVFLVIAIVVALFCIVSIITKGGHTKKQEDIGSSYDEISVPNAISENSQGKENDMQSSSETAGEKLQMTCEFDGWLSGSKQLKEMEWNMGEVPVIVYFMDTYDEQPLLILQHGLTSKKEDVRDFARNLAMAGYVVVTPDAVGHGALKNAEKMPIGDLIEGTANHFGSIISYFESSSYVKIERTGIVGFSLGGLAAFYYTANGEYQPKLVVSLCSTPDFIDLEKSSVADIYYQNGKEKKSKDKNESKEMVELIKEKSPYMKLTENTETCFYLLCGDKDEIVPHEGNLRFYEDMKNKAKDIVLQVKENQKHEVTEEDFIQVLQYIKGHL